MANNTGPPAFASIIHQGETRTNPATWGAGIGNNSLTVLAPFTGDANANNSGTVRWKTPIGAFSWNGTAAMTRHADYFDYTIPGLTPGTQYLVEVEYDDPDGIGTGSAISSNTFTTSGSATTGLITSIAMSHTRVANRAPQTVTFTASVTASAKFVQFHAIAGPNKYSPCLTPSGGVA